MLLSRLLMRLGLCSLRECEGLVKSYHDALSEACIKAERDSYELRRALGDVLYALGDNVLAGDTRIGELTQYEARSVMQAGALLRSSWRKGLAVTDDSCARAQSLAMEYGFDLSEIQRSGDELVNEFAYPELFSLGFDPVAHGPDVLVSFCQTLLSSCGRMTAQQSFDYVVQRDHIELCSA